MTTRTLKKIWLTTVSRAALRFSLAVERDALTSGTQLALGLVARIRLWFQMLWGSVQRTETLSPVLTDIPPNRYYKRRRNSRGGAHLVVFSSLKSYLCKSTHRYVL